ncbi:DoxX family protein [Oscillatoria sp. FACHB-1407]|uniref:DoxX family protein n=1 Tax=Oscillatoria sp. FACHB-1407 TaxID=2692847 RepID=UPI00168354CE|nr:DoxX family protein [Oscillatoria sp. FACHB-1407]MBD2462194.1 DoxX family protein [Oscillatoria sp. FACHB-1407]
MTIIQRLKALTVATFRPNLAPNYPSQIAWTVLRVVAGIVMIHNGLDKLSNIESFAEAYVKVIGLPFPIFFSYLAGYTELIASPLLVLGLFTRPAALGLFSTMLVAMYHHIKVAGFSIPYLELSALYAACFLFYTVNGGGLFSLDALIAGWLDAATPEASEQQRQTLEASYQTSETVSQK